MSATSQPWPLPGQIDPHLTPCAFCRRRLAIGGRPVFTNCSCRAFGPSVTLAALALGAVALGSLGLWWLGRPAARR